MASGSFDQTIRIWDPDRSVCIRTIKAHSDPVLSLKFDHSGELLASCSYDSLIRIWNPANGTCLKTIIENDNPIVYLPSIYLLQGCCILFFGRSFIDFSSNGLFLIAGCLDNKIRIWDRASGACMQVFTGHLNLKYKIDLHMFLLNDRALLISGSEDGSLIVWDQASADLLRTFEIYKDGIPSSFPHFFYFLCLIFAGV